MEMIVETNDLHMKRINSEHSCNFIISQDVRQTYSVVLWCYER